MARKDEYKATEYPGIKQRMEIHDNYLKVKLDDSPDKIIQNQ